MTSLSRRRFLRTSSAIAPGCLSLGAGLSLMGANPALAASGDYKALVCVFLYGGNDGHNTIPPVALDSYQRYANVRQDLAIARNQIVPLNSEIGLHPAMAPLKDVFDANRLAVVNNVGPLARPLTQAQYFDWRDANNPTLVPNNLFSHHDQQVIWENAFSSAELRTGWGGRLMEALNSGQQVYSFNSNSRFGAGARSQEMVIPTPGQQLGLEGFGNNEFANARIAALQNLIQASDSNLLHQRMAESQSLAFDVSNRLGPLLAQAPRNGNADADNPEISAAFDHLNSDGDNYFARQLYQVAKMISQRSVVGGNRHVYFVTLGGFDNHSDQLGTHAGLLTQLGDALQSFDQSMQAINASGDVTLFTESDFGRTLKPNSSAGTDHAWGNMQLVMGGAVSGGRAYGDYPSLELGGPDDAGENEWEHQGRWIPQYSVDQYVATLVNWFAPEAAGQIASVLPNLQRFDNTDIGFMGGSIAG